MKRGRKPGRSEVVWSADLAYATGLMATDGCLSSDGRHLDLTSKDREQLLNFMRCIRRPLPISLKRTPEGRSVSRVQFSDVTLYRFFLDAGLTPKKTHTIGPIAVPEKYFFDFLRGHYDGDGTFYSYYDPRWKNSFMFYLSFVSASRRHILWLRDMLERRIGVKGHITSAKGHAVVQLKYAKAETLIILKHLYPRKLSICLTRKRLKIAKVLRIVGLSLPLR